MPDDDAYDDETDMTEDEFDACWERAAPTTIYRGSVRPLDVGATGIVGIVIRSSMVDALLSAGGRLPVAAGYARLP